MTSLLVGLGSRDRGDDAIGPVVVAEAARRLAGRLPGLRVVEHHDPAALLDLWEGADLAVVVDAVAAGVAPGTTLVIEAGSGAGPLPADPWAGAGCGGTHAIGLAGAVELARALDRLPRRVVIVGVAAGAFAHGAGLSRPVAAAVPAAVDAVCAVLAP